jgi:hypothetical protein
MKVSRGCRRDRRGASTRGESGGRIGETGQRRALLVWPSISGIDSRLGESRTS